MVTLAFILALPLLNSTVAFSAVISISTVGLYISCEPSACGYMLHSLPCLLHAWLSCFCLCHSAHLLGQDKLIVLTGSFDSITWRLLTELSCASCRRYSNPDEAHQPQGLRARTIQSGHVWAPHRDHCLPMGGIPDSECFKPNLALCMSSDPEECHHSHLRQVTGVQLASSSYSRPCSEAMLSDVIPVLTPCIALRECVAVL